MHTEPIAATPCRTRAGGFEPRILAHACPTSPYRRSSLQARALAALAAVAFSATTLGGVLALYGSADATIEAPVASPLRPPADPFTDQQRPDTVLALGAAARWMATPPTAEPRGHRPIKPIGPRECV